MTAAETITRAEANAKGWLASIEEMLARYSVLDERNEDKARAEIEESVLSVQVRGGWHAPGISQEKTNQYGDGAPEEYEILLTTGGPALRIFGRLNDYGEPESAELQHQDWGTPWTRFPAPEATLLAFARVFYFGE